MKKLIAVVLLGLLLCTAGAFADHPNGWGVGILGQYGGSWLGGGGLGGAALSLKVPSVPVFWGINLSFPSHAFGIGVTGDYYLIDQYLVQAAGLGWFFGIGGYVGFTSYANWNSFGFGARLPIGLSWRPVDVFEIFFDFAPSLGLLFYDSSYSGSDNVDFGGGWQGDIGLRFWF